MRKKYFLILSSLLLASGVAAAKSSAGEPQIILPKLYSIDQLEIEAGKMGVAKACNAKLVQYATMIESDHTAHATKVQELAVAKTVDLNQVTVSKWEEAKIKAFKETLDKLNAKTDCTFDKEYAEALRDSHIFGLRVVNRALKHATDADIQALLTATVESMTKHRDEAIQLITEL